ncbi:PP2C family protein-serine/threonine phosphatase [Leptospira sp. GIMC2001]|uniref:PP2C family protein-serine/threonine phosphatase n=1 Tax=Leptospira sp. GIMC2001 TaxID=1513297 RepID=UPI00234A7931|nr:PP2C family protein-serine/threonine phosphatase [Leptospira sp. GIMC2001]WCL49917.1 PP2C family protein-serine/threonine phosphatase [Leptospira sp. GIMC2001]
MFFTSYIIILFVVGNFYFSNTKAENALVAAKELQDGDYFLTTQILNPLFKNFNRSDFVKTEFYAKQKKTFSFRGRDSDLGGDINISGNIIFRGIRYTMFINADAMGKSMQGAGGAIVLGTVVNSLLSRSASNKKSLNLHPREWMNDTYMELQNIFLAFDGSMFISCFMGLVNENNGKMYYFNSEHPSTVLYRDGKAQFLDEEFPHRKIGFPVTEPIKIHEFQLLPGDILIAGCDGRDDTNLTPNSIERKINDDENIFVKIVEKRKADLEGIFEEISKSGELIDDLSLIKIEFLSNPNAENATYIELKQIKTLIKEFYFEDALYALENSSQEDIQNLEQLYLRAFCMEKLGKGSGSIQLLEKNYSIVKDHIPSLNLLSYLYYKTGNLDKSQSLAEIALGKDPSNFSSNKLMNKIIARRKDRIQFI